MREIVIVIADLYWQAEADQEPQTEIGVPPGALPGLTLATRFGQRTPLPEGWPGWFARWLGRGDLAAVEPGTAAASLAQAPLPSTGSLSGAHTAGAHTVWMATPLHLMAGLSSVHLDRRGILRLAPAELEQLAANFAATFGTSEFRLALAPPSDLILVGPHLPGIKTVEPARAILGPLGQALPRGDQAPVLRRLSAEIEMWLHGHAVNQARASRGERPVSSLWLWGGGLWGEGLWGEGKGTLPDAQPPKRPVGDIVFAGDVRARGLWNMNGGDCLPVPDTLADVLGYAQVHRAAVIAEAGPLLQTHPNWTLVEALGALDADFIAPALAALRRGGLGSVTLLANDCSLSVRSKDLRKWWRPRKGPLAGLTT